MKPEERVSNIQKNIESRDLFLAEYSDFIAATAAKATKRYVAKDDDAYAVALVAFNEAIDRYQQEKGGFLSYAALLIRNRLIDEMRKTKRNVIPFSSLQKRDEEGTETDYDPVGEADVISDSALEIQAISEEMNRFGIVFSDLSVASPKSKKTRQECFRVIRIVCENPQMAAEICKKGVLPVQKIQQTAKVGKKLLERHRKYLIAAVLILEGDYPILSQYLACVKEV